MMDLLLPSIGLFVGISLVIYLIYSLFLLFFYYPFGSSANRVYRVELPEGINQVKIVDLKPEEFKSKSNELSDLEMSINVNNKKVSLLFIGRDKEGNLYRAEEVVDSWHREFKVVGAKIIDGEVVVELKKDFKEFFINLVLYPSCSLMFGVYFVILLCLIFSS
jgi:hypothetical protein